ncbi:MAG: ATPase, partial [Methylocystis sp.]|nr:ATPase [Methylocystis sp.]
AARLDGGFAVLLDGGTVKTPAGRQPVVPCLALADALAAEWKGQGEGVDPAAMPLTRLVNAAIDGVAGRMLETQAEVVKYGACDLVCYRASEPIQLALAQAAAWDPLVAFARAKLGADLILAQGVMFAPQPAPALAALRNAVRAYVGDDAASPFRLAALHAATTLTGSCVIAMANALGEIGVAQAWGAAHVDEDAQMDAWGADPESLARRERRYVEMLAAAHLMRMLADEG